MCALFEFVKLTKDGLIGANGLPARQPAREEESTDLDNATIRYHKVEDCAVRVC